MPLSSETFRFIAKNLKLIRETALQNRESSKMESGLALGLHSARLDVLSSVANPTMTRQAFSRNSSRMDRNRRAHLQELIGWTLAWPAIVLGSSSHSRMLASNFDEKGFEAEFPSMGSTVNLRWFSDGVHHYTKLSGKREQQDE